MKEAVNIFVQDKCYLADSSALGSIASRKIAEYFKDNDSPLVLTGRVLFDLDLDFIVSNAKGKVDLVLKDCDIDTISSNCLNAKNVKLTIINSKIKSVSLVKSNFNCLVTDSVLSLNGDSFNGSKFSGGFINNTVKLTISSNRSDIDVMLCKVFNDVVNEISYIKE